MLNLIPLKQRHLDNICVRGCALARHLYSGTCMDLASLCVLLYLSVLGCVAVFVSVYRLLGLTLIELQAHITTNQLIMTREIAILKFVVILCWFLGCSCPSTGTCSSTRPALTYQSLVIAQFRSCPLLMWKYFWCQLTNSMLLLNITVADSASVINYTRLLYIRLMYNLLSVLSLSLSLSLSLFSSLSLSLLHTHPLSHLPRLSSIRDLVHRQTACWAVKHMALGVYGFGCEDALVHLMNYVWPNIFETSPHMMQSFNDAVEGFRVSVGPGKVLQYTLQVSVVEWIAVRLTFTLMGSMLDIKFCCNWVGVTIVDMSLLWICSSCPASVCVWVSRGTASGMQGLPDATIQQGKLIPLHFLNVTLFVPPSLSFFTCRVCFTQPAEWERHTGRYTTLSTLDHRLVCLLAATLLLQASPDFWPSYISLVVFHYV